MDKLIEFAIHLGIDACIPFDVALLHPEDRIREMCRFDRCGNYRKNYMCPPNIGSPEEIAARLKTYEHGLLLRYRRPLDVKNDPVGLTQSKLDFHDKVLRLEEKIKAEGYDDVWGLIGGDCVLCNACAARIDAPCHYPEQARTSLESIAVDVLGLLEKLGEDSGFHPDVITWTGCVLF